MPQTVFGASGHVFEQAPRVARTAAAVQEHAAEVREALA